MGTEQRPYIGTWNIQEKKVVQHTPDCLVYINGDLTLPGVDTKGSQYRIDVQKFITSVQVDAGTTPSSASANISMSIPVHSREPIARDANYIFRVGLEVHIYMRGYFPVRGLFRGQGNDVQIYDDKHKLIKTTVNDEDVLIESQTKNVVTGTVKTWTLDDHYVADNFKSGGDDYSTFDGRQGKGKEVVGKTAAMAETYAMLLQHYGYTNATMHDHNACILSGSAHVSHSSHHSGQGIDQNSREVRYDGPNGNTHIPFYVTFAMNVVGQEYGYVPSGGVGWYGEKSDTPGITYGFGGGTGPHADWRGGWYGNRTSFRPRIWYWRDAEGNKVDKSIQWKYKDGSDLLGTYQIDNADIPQYVKDEIYKLRKMFEDGDFKTVPTAEEIWNARVAGQSTIEKDGDLGVTLNLSGTNRGTYVGQGNFRPKTRYDDLFAYPYYHVFHGVITNVSFSYSPGVQTATLQCGSMLHFWSYQNMSSNAAVMGARPSNSKNRVSLLGHNFTGKHPYEIIYTLFHDTAGAAGAVNFVLNQKTNVDSVLGENSLYSLTIKYWEKRFSQRMMNLRLHGATGALFNTFQAVAMAKLSTSDMKTAFSKRHPNLSGQSPGKGFMQSLYNLGLLSDQVKRSSVNNSAKSKVAQANQTAQGQVPTDAQITQTSFGNSGDFNKKGLPIDLNVFMMEAYVKNIGQIAQINLFESAYETKMDIANKVCEITGFEFYQDVDGDCVFKPPMYNLDTSRSRVFRIEDIDIINFSESEKEPEVTYMITKGSTFANLAGTGVEGEWGVQGTFIDYPLVAKYGWRPGSFETAYFNDARQCFFASINRMAVMNASVHSGSVTIPIRPELRPGYPIYHVSNDCFWYATSISHQFQVGGSCQTTLQLIAKRSKFFAPGDPYKQGIESIKLNGFGFPPKPLKVISRGGYSELSGYPNVVMTIDPELINPMFFISGSDFESLTNPENLQNLIDILLTINVAGNAFEYDKATGVFKWTQNGKTKYFSIKDATQQQWNHNGDSPSRSISLMAAAGSRDNRRAGGAEARWNTRLAQLQQKVSALNDAIQKCRDQKSKTLPGLKDGDDKQQRRNQIHETLDKKIADLEKKVIKAQKAYDDHASKPPKQSQRALFSSSAKGVDYLQGMLNLVRQHGKDLDGGRFKEGWDQLDSSSNLLDLLDNKKANMSNGQVPGSYRYYSSASPKKEDQGRIITLNGTGKNKNWVRVKSDPCKLTTPVTGKQYVPSTSIIRGDVVYQAPEAQLNETATILYGLPLIGAQGKEEVVATQDIYTLRFMKVKGRIKRQKYMRVRDYQRGWITHEAIFEGMKKIHFDWFETGSRMDDWQLIVNKINELGLDLNKSANNIETSLGELDGTESIWFVLWEFYFKYWLERVHKYYNRYHPRGNKKAGWNFGMQSGAGTWPYDGNIDTRANAQTFKIPTMMTNIMAESYMRTSGRFYAIEGLTNAQFLLSLNEMALGTQVMYTKGWDYVEGGTQNLSASGGTAHNKCVLTCPYFLQSATPPANIYKTGNAQLRLLWASNGGKDTNHQELFNVCKISLHEEWIKTLNFFATDFATETMTSSYRFQVKNDWAEKNLAERHYHWNSAMAGGGFQHYNTQPRSWSHGWNPNCGILNKDKGVPTEQTVMTLWCDLVSLHNDLGATEPVGILFSKFGVDKPVIDMLSGQRIGLRQSYNSEFKASANWMNNDSRWGGFDAEADGGVLPAYFPDKGEFSIEPTSLFVPIGHIFFRHEMNLYTDMRYSERDTVNGFGQLNRATKHGPAGASRAGALNSIRNILFYHLSTYFYQHWELVEAENRKWKRRGKVSQSYENKLVKFMQRTFRISSSPFTYRMANVWGWYDYTTEIPVFPISDSMGYEVFGHYPYGRGLDIFADNPLDTLLQTDPFLAVDRETVENYILAMQQKTVTITDPQTGVKNTLSGQKAIDESTKALSAALKGEFSPQELLDYGLGTLNAKGKLEISIQNWMADKKNDGVQKLTVENQAFSLADLGFLSDLASVPSDMRTSQADVLLPAYSTNFAEVILSTKSNNSATLLEQLLEPTAGGDVKTPDMAHTIIMQENRSPNWVESQKALRGTSFETENSADRINQALQPFDELLPTLSDGVDKIVKAQEAQTKAQKKLEEADDIDGQT